MPIGEVASGRFCVQPAKQTCFGMTPPNCLSLNTVFFIPIILLKKITFHHPRFTELNFVKNRVAKSTASETLFQQMAFRSFLNALLGIQLELFLSVF